MGLLDWWIARPALCALARVRKIVGTDDRVATGTSLHGHLLRFSASDLMLSRSLGFGHDRPP
jgi:hypothetical protein